MLITLDGCSIRSFRSNDDEEIARHANNRKIWRNLRDGFPHPYSPEDARRFLEMAAARDPESFYCIAVEDGPIGSIGFSLQQDVHRFTAEIGYWVAQDYWGRGIATQSLRALTRYAMEVHKLHRIYATPYEWSKASCRVLEKAGYRLEGRLHKSAFKDGHIIDQLMYAFTSQDSI